MSTRPRAQEVWEVLDAALELPPEEREGRIEELCGGRPELVAELRSLLAEPPQGFLARSPVDSLPPDEAPRRGPEATPSLVLGGKYVLHERIGEGAMGAVFRGEHLKLGRPVAIKLLHETASSSDEELARLVREARAASAVHHENVVAVRDVDLHEGRAYMVMEWIEGVDLFRLLARAQQDGLAPREPTLAALRAAFDALSPRPSSGEPWQRSYWELVATVAARVARAAQAAHECGLVHRDISPKNILLTPEGKPYLFDFGVAILTAAEGARTTRRDVAGTLPYMAPEQLRGGIGAKRPAVDVYGLGATIYHLAAGRPPFAGDEPARILHDVPPSLRALRPDLPRDLEAIALAAMEKRAASRYASAAGLADDLEAFLERRPVSRRPPGVLGRLTRWAWRRPAAAVAVASLTLLLVAGTSAAVLLQREAQRAEARDRRERFAAAYAELPALATIEPDARYASAPIAVTSDAGLGPVFDELVALEPGRPMLRWLRASHASQRGELARAAAEVAALRSAGHGTPLFEALSARLVSENPIERNQLVALDELPATEGAFDHGLVGHTALRWRDLRAAWQALTRAIEMDSDEWLYRDLRAIAGMDLVGPDLYVEDALRVEAVLGRSSCRTLHVRAYASRWPDPARAGELWTASLELGGPQHQPLHNLGELLFWEDRFEEAQARLAEAVRIKPGSWKSWILLSRCAEARGEFELADERLAQGARDLPAGGPSAAFTPLEELALERANLHAAWGAALAAAGDGEAARARTRSARELLAPLLAESSASDDALRLELEAMQLSLARQLGETSASEAVPRLRELHAGYLHHQGFVSASIAVSLGGALVELDPAHRVEAEALLLQGLQDESTRAEARAALRKLE